jgi:DNA-binding MarR family transcriptional regulator
VCRAVDDADRRAVLVELTASGREVLEAITEARVSVLDRYLDALTATERDALAAALPGLKKLTERGIDAEEHPGVMNREPRVR